MEQQQTINFGGIVSAVIEVNNQGDESRQYDIHAQARLSGDQVEAVESGTVMKDGQQVADFNGYQQGYLSINFQPADSRDEVYQAVEAFIEAVRQQAAQAARALSIGQQQEEEGGAL